MEEHEEKDYKSKKSSSKTTNKEKNQRQSKKKEHSLSEKITGPSFSNNNLSSLDDFASFEQSLDFQMKTFLNVRSQTKPFKVPFTSNARKKEFGTLGISKSLENISYKPSTSKSFSTFNSQDLSIKLVNKRLTYQTSLSSSKLDLTSTSSCPISSSSSSFVLMNSNNSIMNASSTFLPLSSISSSFSFSSSSDSKSVSSKNIPSALFSSKKSFNNKKGEEFCVVCSDKASGFHYNALSCEGCKGFFRRTITRKLQYHCKFGGDCLMDLWSRRRCPACRLKMCYQVGMKEDCLLSEHQCLMRNSRRKMNMRLKQKELTKNEKPIKALSTSTPFSGEGVFDSEVMPFLAEEQRELIRRVVELQDIYELPSKEDLNLLSNQEKLLTAKTAQEMADAFFVFNIEMTILVTRLIVDFAKRLPGFKNLSKEDQIVLLKASSSEIMMIKAARRYDPSSDSIIFGNEMPFSIKDVENVGMKEGALDMFEFSRKMNKLKVDNSEYALFIAICIFSNRPGLHQEYMVEKLQEIYLDVLISYVKVRRKNQKSFLAKLLSMLTLLRDYGLNHNRFLYNLTLKRGALPPLLSEYFDLSDS